MQFSSQRDFFSLNDKNKIPCIGFGTWQAKNGQECYDAVFSALNAGYTHIDTAAAYENEESVGRALANFLSQNGISREKIFVTTKLKNPDHGYQSTKSAINRSLENLQLDYIDLYLIHWPNPLMFRNCWAEKNAESYLAMEEAVSKGFLRSIGVSNFCERHLLELEKTQKILPAVNQIKLCPGQPQSELVNFCRKKSILLEGYSPMGTGKIFSNEKMISIAKKYDRTVAQICIRWSLQSGFLPLPKSVTPSRIAENLKIFDFELSSQDLIEISELKQSGILPARNPDEAPF